MTLPILQFGVRDRNNLRLEAIRAGDTVPQGNDFRFFSDHPTGSQRDVGIAALRLHFNAVEIGVSSFALVIVRDAPLGDLSVSRI